MAKFLVSKNCLVSQIPSVTRRLLLFRINEDSIVFVDCLNSGNEDNWNVLLALTCIPALLCLAVWYYLPETPRYLFVLQQKTDLAFKGLFTLAITSHPFGQHFHKFHPFILNYCAFILELSRLRGLPVDQLGPEMEELRREATRVTAEMPKDGLNNTNSQSSWTLKTIWAKKSLRWAFACVVVMHLGNQLSGINAVGQ